MVEQEPFKLEVLGSSPSGPIWYKIKRPYGRIIFFSKMLHWESNSGRGFRHRRTGGETGVSPWWKVLKPQGFKESARGGRWVLAPADGAESQRTHMI